MVDKKPRINFYKNLNKIIKLTLKEDVGVGDLTSLATIPQEQIGIGEFYAKADGIIAGLKVVNEVCKIVDPTLVFTTTVIDGDKVSNGTAFAKITGSVRSILMAERTALNFLQRMSGIATATDKYIQAVKPYKAKLLDTRKTVPGLRMLDKLAVKLGGGVNHRIGLYDMALIKDNHIAAVGSITEAINRVREFDKGAHQIEVEVKNIEELKEALTQKPDRIMLDNMSIGDMKEAVDITNSAIPLEASGNVNLNTINSIASTGVDYISVGALTHSVKAMDISLEITAN